MRLVFLMFLFCSSFIVSGQTILPLRERAKAIEAIQEDRLENLLPELMSKTNLDMWVIITREYNEDPVIKTLLPPTWLNARRRTILVFSKNPISKKVERVALTHYAFGKHFPSVWYKTKNPDQFKALIINQEGDNFTREIKSIDKSFLKHGDVTIKVDYSDLNFKDGMILKNGGRLVKEFPHIPGIDFSGTVIESENSKFKEGDEVILTGFRVGEVFFGGYSQIAKVNADFLVKKPKYLTSKQAMILGTAGFTSLMSAFAIQARESILLGEKVNDVLVTGATGGVGSVAVMALSKLGYNVTAVTGKDSKADYLKSLGAKTVVNRSEFDKDPRLIDKGLWDGVVDTVGGKILANTIVQTKPNGIIAVCGNANNNELNTSVIPFMLRGIKLWGMDSANCSIKRREFIWSEASKLIDFDLLEKSIVTVSLEELIETYPKILKGEISGRVIVDLNK